MKDEKTNPESEEPGYTPATPGKKGVKSIPDKPRTFQGGGTEVQK